jgi:Uma2 family endonuclease
VAEPAEERWTVEEFLAWGDGTDRRYELVRGQIVAMAPPGEEHSTIVANLTFELRTRLEPPCRLLGQAGIALPGRDDTFYEADLAVTCAQPQPGRRHAPEPILIAEVLSPSTAAHDRTRKLDDHRRLPSVREILLVTGQEHTSSTGAARARSGWSGT